jgi:uncharacterized membrane protein
MPPTTPPGEGRATSQSAVLGRVRPLAAFAVPNYRRFTIGQTISLVGSWTETVAQAVLVLQLTHSGIWLGLATAARYAPVLVLTPYAGVIVDRYDKRRLLLVTHGPASNRCHPTSTPRPLGPAARR